MPIALPVIIAGVRNAVVINIAIAAIATYIGAGGLGTFISRGISQTDIRQLLTGALAVEPARDRRRLSRCSRLQRALTSPGFEADAMIRLERVTKVFGTVDGGRQRRHGGAGRRDLRAARSVRLRQDHDDEDDQPAGRADVGQDLHRRARHRRGRRGHAAPHDRLRDPADRPVPEHDGRGEHLRRARPARLGRRAKSRKRAAELLAMVELPPAMFLKRYPKELSGGQQQRVGVVRALAADPPVLLMDEPFGAIDPINREVIQDEFMKLQAELKKTIMFVSHDIDEAVKMAARIAIFRDGRLIQYDTPEQHARPPGQRLRRRVRRQRPHAEAPAPDQGRATP